MNVLDLPRWAIAFPDESRWSWLEGTRRLLCLPEREWLEWCNYSAREPERSTGGMRWRGAPKELGDIHRIPPGWRISPEWRGIVCPRCLVLQEGLERHPVLVDWLDSRTIACSRHGVLLNYSLPEAPRDVDFDPEVASLNRWLVQWRRRVPEASKEGRFCRDLVVAASRNWSSHEGDIASIELAWVLREKNWLLPTSPRGQIQLPGHPARVGTLPPALRVAALLGAYRAWRSLAGKDVHLLPSWPPEAWQWLAARSLRRNGDEQRTQLLAALARAHSPDGPKRTRPMPR